MRRLLGGLIALVVVAGLPATAAAHNKPPRWKPVPTGSDQQYRGLDAVDKRTAWVGGSDGFARGRQGGGDRRRFRGEGRMGDHEIRGRARCAEICYSRLRPDTTLGDFHDMREALRPLEHTRAASRRDPNGAR